ncbi:MAG TPA: BamA/TamA family outer membrane protein [Candidatus Polarisedimenticolia bacterium]|nr:BamA/TamA family outer membrane protein [Candidatus Polarisedimenticolia bacterium]
MSPSSARARLLPGLCLLILVLVAGDHRVHAAAVGRIAAVNIVDPGPGPAHRPVFTEAEVRGFLDKFLGLPCDPVVVAESLARRYRFLGYVPSITASCEEGALVLSIRESSHRIDLITFDPGDLAHLGLKESTDYEAKLRLYPVPAGATRAVLRGLLQTRPGDIYNHERYRSDSEALRRLGYAVAFVPGPASDPAAYPSGAYLVQSLAPQPSESSRRRRRTNYMGGTASYGPRAGPAVGAVYEKDDLLDRFDRLTLTPRYNGGLGGDLAYTAPLLSATEEPRRLYDVETTVYSDFLQNRLLDGLTTDERRSGASVTLGLRPLALPAPNNLRLTFGLRHERVNLSRALPGQEEERLTVLQLGAVEEWRRTFRWPSLSARLAPTFDLSRAAGGAGRSFVRPGLDAGLHARRMSGLETDLHLVAGTLDRHVPSTEAWSLGGAMTVRGFREDSFLGRHLGALQSELWLPFVRPQPARPLQPGVLEEDTGATPFEPRAARFLKWALFLDAGMVSGTPDGRNVPIAGAGIGLRFAVPHQPLVARLDYGWGLGGRGGDAFPYVSIAYRF